MPREPVSVVILTRDEAANIEECLDAIIAQWSDHDEIVVVDAASRDGTVAICERYAEVHPGRIRMHAFPVAVGFGEARNAGIDMARSDVIAFVSADAVPEPTWLDALRAAIGRADVVYGRQRHAPPKQNATTVSRGLRYHHFERAADELPETYASNVNAAYRRFVFHAIRFDADLPGSEDVAFAKHARLAGLRLAYAPHAVVRHKDVATLRGEWRKHVREGRAQAQLRDLLGAPRMHLAWLATVLALVVGAIALLNAWVGLAAIVAFFAPTLRRLATSTARQYRGAALAGGAAISPFFDLAYVASFLTSLTRKVRSP